tara:strand:+ start:1617 stop:1847 length:231 start_codon:yes stop_codon:yes gene_type:complete
LAQLVRNYFRKLEKLEDKIKEDADNILKAIDLDELLVDPEGYLMALSDAFLKEHMIEIEQAVKEGQRFARQVLDKS